MGQKALLVVAGFGIGVAVTMMWRRPAPAIPAPPPAESVKPVARAEPPAPPTDVPDPAPAPVSSALPPPSAKKSADPDRHIIGEPSKTKYGRPPRPKTSDLIKASTWDDFYRLCKERAIRGETLEDLILRRVAAELEVDAAIADSLKDLFQAEQQEATKAVIEAVGGIENFENIKMGTELYETVKRHRQVVRDSYNAEYLKLIPYEKLAVFNEHLRNSEIEMANSYSSEGNYHLVGGVGKNPK